MNVLFICNQNMHRSKTAEEIFSSQFKTQSAGLYNEPPVSKNQLEWADMILVMEETQRSELGKRFPDMYLKKQILSLDIQDIYQYNQPELKDMLTKKINHLAIQQTVP